MVDRNLGVSSATIRNEMARLEEEGYIIRPHTSAGSMPTDKGYRYYVESIGEAELPVAEQERLASCSTVSKVSLTSG
jgi:heat-inducible transcriptional repressor